MELESGWRVLIRSSFRHGKQPAARAFFGVWSEMQLGALVRGPVHGQHNPMLAT